MMWLFEDDKDAPMSRLLSCMYPGCVDFSGGNENLRKYIKMYADSPEFVCFIDFVVDNIATVNLYDVLSSDFRNVTFVRIPCIEYFAFILLKYLGVNRPSSVSFEDVMWYTLNGSCPVGLYTQDSFEKYVKSLTEIEPKCLNTSSSKRERGKFYYKECFCSSKPCDIVSGEISLSRKGEIVTQWLPVNSPNLWEEIYSRITEVCRFNIRSKEK